ncbi:MAG: cation diffusion facilitator family transporter [Caldisericaceae bacterium]
MNKEEFQSSGRRRVFYSILLNILITVVEFVGGIFSGSLALISDSLHNLSDTVAGILTYWTLKLSTKARNEKYTFGYKRAEIISAFVNSSVLIVLAVLLLREAVLRFAHPETVSGGIMLPVAIIGLLANSASALFLHGHAEHNLNIKSEYLHLLSDALSSVAVVIGGIIIAIWKISWIDPVLTVIIAIYMSYESIEILKETLNILMESCPSSIRIPDIEQDVLKIDGVKDIHHIHVWKLSDEDTLFEAHVNVSNVNVEDTKTIREAIEKMLKENYEINHSTIQFEFNEHLTDGLIKAN